MLIKNDVGEEFTDIQNIDSINPSINPSNMTHSSKKKKRGEDKLVKQ